MEALKRFAVPLCLPENWSFNGEKATGDKTKGRGSMKLCIEGKKLLKEIGDDEIAVICVTGPARSGKSYLLSKLLDDVFFEVGHGVVSKTTGIWIACSQTKKEVEGNQKARIVLLDAEGAGAVSTEDDAASGEWDTKLFSLCCLSSSMMIYNSKNIPQSIDLERLQFVANFSSALYSTDKSTPCFKTCAPKLFWILRDVLTYPEPFQDWEEYFDNQVFVKRPERTPSDRSFNEVVDAIKNVFHSFCVKALPPPSNKSLVCKNLHKSEHLEDIKDFLVEIEDVKSKILKTTPVKRTGTRLMSGKDLLSVLEVYVKELNKESGAISIRTCWDATITLYLENIVQSSYEELEKEVAEMKLPLKVQEIIDKFAAVAFKTERNFLAKISLKDCKIVSSFLKKLKQKCDRSLKSLQIRNLTASKLFCQTKVQEIKNFHLENTLQNAYSFSIIKQLQLCNNVIKQISEEYMKLTKGLPEAEKTFQKANVKIYDQVQSRKELILLNQMCEIYKVHMNSVTLPVEETKLAEENEKAKSQAYESCHEGERYLRPTNIFQTKRENRISKLFEQFQDKNKDKSLAFCKRVMDDILNDKTLKRRITNPSIFDFLSDKIVDRFVKKYHKKAIGPAKFQVEKDLKAELVDVFQEMKDALSRRRQEFLEAAQKKAVKVGTWTAFAAGTIMIVGVAGIAVAVAAPAIIVVAGVALKVSTGV